MSLACPTAQQLLCDGPSLQPLNFAVVGLNHQTAPVKIRERAAIRADEENVILEHLARHAHEVMLLSTCNRTEVYFAGLESDAIAAFEGAWGHALEPYLYVKNADQAVNHLYRVAAGLDSLVIGETQIQGQVKRAWQNMHARGLSGTLLNKIAQGALAAGKRVRFETGMSDKVVSVSSAAVELAESVLGGLTGRTALIIGAGETAELTLTHLKAAGMDEVIVVNRTQARAQQLAAKFKGSRVCASEYLQEALPEVDVIIASSGAPHYVLEDKHLQTAIAQRKQQGRTDSAMFLIDISVPRILNPNIADVSDAHLYNLDDLTSIVSQNMASRRAALPQAEAIIREGAAELHRWYFTRQAQSTKHLAVASD